MSSVSGSIRMAADSTQSETRSGKKRKKAKESAESSKSKKSRQTKSSSRRKDTKKKDTKKKRTSSAGIDESSDCESDLDLEKPLKAIGGYIKQRDDMVHQMFKSIRGAKLVAMLPDILKPLPLEELKKLCTEQLEVMSKKRVCRILDGADPETISSSGTEESTDNEEETALTLPGGGLCAATETAVNTEGNVESTSQPIHEEKDSDVEEIAAGQPQDTKQDSPISIHSDEEGDYHRWDQAEGVRSDHSRGSSYYGHSSPGSYSSRSRSRSRSYSHSSYSSRSRYSSDSEHSDSEYEYYTPTDASEPEEGEVVEKKRRRKLRDKPASDDVAAVAAAAEENVAASSEHPAPGKDDVEREKADELDREGKKEVEEEKREEKGDEELKEDEEKEKTREEKEDVKKEEGQEAAKEEGANGAEGVNGTWFQSKEIAPEQTEENSLLSFSDLEQNCEKDGSERRHSSKDEPCIAEESGGTKMSPEEPEATIQPSPETLAQTEDAQALSDAEAESMEVPSEVPAEDPEAPPKGQVQDSEDPEAPAEEQVQDPEAPHEGQVLSPEAPPEEQVQDLEAPPEEKVLDPEAPLEKQIEDPETPAEEKVLDLEAPPEEQVLDIEAPPEGQVQDPETPPEKQVQDLEAPPEVQDQDTKMSPKEQASLRRPPELDQKAETDTLDTQSPPKTATHDVEVNTEAPPEEQVKGSKLPSERITDRRRSENKEEVMEITMETTDDFADELTPTPAQTTRADKPQHSKDSRSRSRKERKRSGSRERSSRRSKDKGHSSSHHGKSSKRKSSGEKEDQHRTRKEEADKEPEKTKKIKTMEKADGDRNSCEKQQSPTVDSLERSSLAVERSSLAEEKPSSEPGAVEKPQSDPSVQEDLQQDTSSDSTPSFKPRKIKLPAKPQSQAVLMKQETEDAEAQSHEGKHQRVQKSPSPERQSPGVTDSRRVVPKTEVVEWGKGRVQSKVEYLVAVKDEPRQNRTGRKKEDTHKTEQSRQVIMEPNNIQIQVKRPTQSSKSEHRTKQKPATSTASSVKQSLTSRAARTELGPDRSVEVYRHSGEVRKVSRSGKDARTSRDVAKAPRRSSSTHDATAKMVAGDQRVSIVTRPHHSIQPSATSSTKSASEKLSPGSSRKVVQTSPQQKKTPPSRSGKSKEDTHRTVVTSTEKRVSSISSREKHVSSGSSRTVEKQRQSKSSGSAARGSTKEQSQPVLSKTQREILELEMRARAIKAMLLAQEELEHKTKNK